MLAVRAGASLVYACEMSKTMFEVATDIISANGMSTNIHLIHKNSTELIVPEDIPGRSVPSTIHTDPEMFLNVLEFEYII